MLNSLNKWMSELKFSGNFSGCSAIKECVKRIDVLRTLCIKISKFSSLLSSLILFKTYGPNTFSPMTSTENGDHHNNLKEILNKMCGGTKKKRIKIFRHKLLAKRNKYELIKNDINNILSLKGVGKVCRLKSEIVEKYCKKNKASI